MKSAAKMLTLPCFVRSSIDSSLILLSHPAHCKAVQPKKLYRRSLSEERDILPASCKLWWDQKNWKALSFFSTSFSRQISRFSLKFWRTVRRSSGQRSWMTTSLQTVWLEYCPLHLLLSFVSGCQTTSTVTRCSIKRWSNVHQKFKKDLESSLTLSSDFIRISSSSVSSTGLSSASLNTSSSRGSLN